MTVTPEEAARQRDNVGILTEQLEGRVLALGEDSLGLAIREWEGSPADRPHFSTYISVPRTEVVQIEEKRLSVGRTAAFAGAAFAVAVAVLALNERSGGNKQEPPPTTELRIPIRLPFWR